MRNNRTAGHKYERDTVKKLKDLGYADVVTSRAESRNMDNRGVDIFGPSMPFHVQCKNSVRDLKYHKLFKNDKLPNDKPLVIFHKRTQKANKRFVKVGEYVIMEYETFKQFI
jgi:Holliday junction resolvase